MTSENDSPDSDQEPKTPNEHSQAQRPDITVGPNNESIKAKEGSCCGTNKQDDNNWRPAERWEVAVGIILVLATVTTACIYIGQLRQMKKATKAAGRSAKTAEAAVRKAEASAHLDQRAWVALYSIEGFPEVDKEFMIKATIRNTGKTFARHYKGIIRPEAFKPSQQRQPDFGAEENIPAEKPAEVSIGLLPPNGEYIGMMNVNSNHAKVAQADVDEVKSGEVIFLLHGRIDYDDIFGCHHWTMFCYRLNSAITSYSAYESHNDADNNLCP